MHIAYQAAKLLSIAAFLHYGVLCLFSNGMAQEFERFGLSRFRRLTGALEILGALGLIAGYFLPPLVIAASAGLVLLMVLGVITRLRVRDSALETSPALFLLAVNAFVLIRAVDASAS